MKSLEYVQQQDGSFRWEMVELSEFARAHDAAPSEAAVEQKPARAKRRSVTEDPTPQTAEYEF